ncbi:MAG TPA: Rid family hydrolase [Sphingomicrobium sp.]|nr:Rid family hydrolase [Sphingomicrobium sp.]
MLNWTLLALVQAPNPAAPAVDHRIIYSDNAELRRYQEQIGWADAVVAGDIVYVSGVIAGTRPIDKGLEPAYTRAFETLTRILKRAGVSWANVVEVRSFHTDPNNQIEAMAAVKRRYRAAPDPAWTAVGTPGLLAPNGITEIALVAHKPRAKAK